jgi:hypothetical protein
MGAGGYIRATSFESAWQGLRGLTFRKTPPKAHDLRGFRDPTLGTEQNRAKGGNFTPLVRIHNYRDLIGRVTGEVVAISRVARGYRPRPSR